VFGAHSFRSVVARNNDILKKLVLEAKREYEKDAEHRVHIYMADTWANHNYICFPALIILFRIFAVRIVAGDGTVHARSVL
jgi:hypothetical protein